MDPTKQKILQWNMRGINNKKHELTYLLNRHSPSIIAISETWLKPGFHFRLPGYACFRDDGDIGYQGSALFIKHPSRASLISLPPHNHNFNIIAVRAYNISLVSLYIPHPHVSYIPEIKSILASLQLPFVILGDFNCHHPVWGSTRVDNFATRILDLLDSLNICILNDGSPTRRTAPDQNRSAVDLSLCSSSIASELNWNILPNSHGSDHFPILITFNSLDNISPKRNPPLLEYRTSKADWAGFSTSMDASSLRLPTVTSHNVLNVYSDFNKALIKAAKENIPPKIIKKRRISPPWWDSECSEAVKKRNNMERSLSRLMTVGNYIEFKMIAAQTTRLLRKKKKQGWLKFCTNLSPRSPASIVWQNIKRFRNSYVDKTITGDPSLWLGDFADKLAPPFAPCRDNYIFTPVPLNNNDHSKLNEPFTHHELDSILKRVKDSSPGVDGIPYSFLVRAGSSSRNTFLAIVNCLFSFCIVPEEWRRQIVIPIPKPGKDHSTADGYRPIALSSCLSKIMEHLIKNRLEWWLERESVIADSQFGFRRGFGVMDSLGIFSTDIRLAFSQGKSVVAVFLDINSAYDNVIPSVLRHKMQELSIPARLTNYISKLFMTRHLDIRAQGTSLPLRSTWRGLPQGSVLSPILYNLYTFDLDRSVQPFCNILQYADDLALYITVQNPLEAQTPLNNALSYLYDWFSEHGLSLSVAKSKTVIFTRKKLIPNIDITYDNQNIPTSDTAKFLGLVFDTKMTGIPHVNEILNKCERSLNVLRCLSGVWWGAHPFTQKILYNALIRSHLDYGSFLLEPCNRAALTKLNRIQFRSLRLILGAMRSSPVNALQVEGVDPPLHLRRQQLSDRFYFKKFLIKTHPLHERLYSLNKMKHLKYWSNKKYCLLNSYTKIMAIEVPIRQYHKNPLFESEYGALFFKPNIITNIDIDKECPAANRKFNAALSQHWPHGVPIYTDASKLSREGCVGLAVWIPSLNIILSQKLPPEATVYTGEATAILDAIKFCTSNSVRQPVICSDSKSCLQSIMAGPYGASSGHTVIHEIRNLLYNCFLEDMNITLVWIPGHSGITGNETVDGYAKDAVVCGGTDYYVVHCMDLLPVARNDLLFSWSVEWRQSATTKGSFYFAIQPSIPPKPWFYILQDFNREVTTIICRMRLGHCCTPVHLAKLRIKDSSICECGLDEGTLDHIFFKCSKYPASLYDSLPPEVPLPSNFPPLLSMDRPKIILLIAKYIHKHNIRL